MTIIIYYQSIFGKQCAVLKLFFSKYNIKLNLLSYKYKMFELMKSDSLGVTGREISTT